MLVVVVNVVSGKDEVRIVQSSRDAGIEVIDPDFEVWIMVIFCSATMVPWILFSLLFAVHRPTLLVAVVAVECSESKDGRLLFPAKATGWW